MDVQTFLAALRVRLRRVLVLDALARTIVMGLFSCAVAIGIDYCWPVPGLLRLVFLIAIVGSVSALVHRRLLRPLSRRMDDRAMAQLAERRLPQLDGRLLTRVDGIDIGTADVQAMIQVLTPATTIRLVPARSLPVNLTLATCFALAAVGIIFGSPRFTQDGLSRLFLPLGDTQWQRHSMLSGSLDRQVVAVDEPLLVRIRRDKGPEAPLRLSWHLQNGGEVERRMLSGLSGPWHQALSLPLGTYDIVAESDDALPLRLTGQLVRRPMLKRIDATLTPPAYVNRPAQQLSTLTCSALAGSHLDFTLEFVVPNGDQILSPHLSFGDGELPVSVTQTSLHAALDIRKGGVISISIKDRNGIDLKPEPTFTVALIEDRKPVVALDGPRNHEAVTLRAHTALVVAASDDFGLKTLQLLSTVLAHGPDEAGQAPKPDAKPDTQPSTAAPAKQKSIDFPEVAGLLATSCKHTVVVGDMAKETDTIVLVGKASDANNITGPGIGQSEPLELRVVTEGELRSEFDRLLTEARNRIEQGIDELGRGIASPDRLVVNSRSATQDSSKASDIIVDVVRRWSENQLTPEQLVPIAKASDIISGPVMTSLAKAVQGNEAEAHKAQDGLDEAYRLLGATLQEGNLTRLLQSILDHEVALNKETRAFLLDHLLAPLDEAAKAREANLAARQNDLAAQTRDIERRILADSSKQMEQPQALIRAETPSDQLQVAGENLAGDAKRSESSAHQEKAIATITKILDQLHGSDAAGELAKQLGKLAARQAEINDQLTNGKPPKSLEQEQKKLKEDTEQVLSQLAKHPKASKLVAAATAAQGEAGKSMAGDDESGAQREGSTAAALLKQAEKDLSGQDDDKDDKKKPDKKTHDLLALLSELAELQTQLIADSNVTFQRLGEKPLDFKGQREVPEYANKESDILLRLREEGLKIVEKMPIVVVELQRVATALERAQQHLATPALGAKGMILEKIALTELTRLLDIVQNIPGPEKKEPGRPGQGNGSGEQAPFPPGTELALLMAMEQEVSQLTATERPVDLAGMQQTIGGLVEELVKQSPPGTRPRQLLDLTKHAMDRAGSLLANNDHGLDTRSEESVAETALRRLLAEAKASSGGKNKKQPDQKPQGGQSKNPTPSQSMNSSTPGHPNQPHLTAGQNDSVQGAAITGTEADPWLRLPPERREEIKQARDQHMPPAEEALFRHYLELLEGNK